MTIPNSTNLADKNRKMLRKNDRVVWRYSDEDGNQIEKQATIVGVILDTVVVLDYNNQYAYTFAKNLEKISA